MDSFLLEGILITLTMLMRAVCILVVLSLFVVLVTALLVEFGFIDAGPQGPARASSQEELDLVLDAQARGNRVVWQDGRLVERTPVRARRPRVHSS